MENITASKGGRVKFSLGAIVYTPKVEAEWQAGALTMDQMAQFIIRHQCGDWGVVDGEDAKENEGALARGFRLLSAYPYTPEAVEAGRPWGDGVVWVITEADRTSTTLLLPEEY